MYQNLLNSPISRDRTPHRINSTYRNSLRAVLPAAISILNAPVIEPDKLLWVVPSQITGDSFSGNGRIILAVFALNRRRNMTRCRDLILAPAFRRRFAQFRDRSISPTNVRRRFDEDRELFGARSQLQWSDRGRFLIPLV